MVDDFQEILEKNNYKMQRLFGKDFSYRGKRCLTYLSQNTTRQLLKQTICPPSIGMTLGGTLGGVLGMIGGPKGAAVGAGSGIGVGFFAGSSYATYKTRKDYKRWLRQYRADEIMQEFDDLLKKHPYLQEFKCSLSGQLMHFPYVDPWGHSYEKQAILNWVQKHKTSPKTKKPITEADLRPNYLLMGKLAKLYHEMLEKELSQANYKLSPIQMQGISILLGDLREQIKLCFYSENQALLKMLKKGDINSKTYSRQLSILSDFLTF